MFGHNRKAVSLDGHTHRRVEIARQLRNPVVRRTEEQNLAALIGTQNQGAPELIQDVGHL
jgi:ABC-type lipopolysaccharide export system ATPase subunit